MSSSLDVSSKRPASPGSEVSSASKRRNDDVGNRHDSQGSQSAASGMSSPMRYEFSSQMSQLPSVLFNDRNTGGGVVRRFDIQSDLGNRPTREISVVGDSGSQQQQINLESNLTAGSAGPQVVVWGTDVSINVLRDKFKKFIKYFKVQSESELEYDETNSVNDFSTEGLAGGRERSDAYYLNKLKEAFMIGEKYFNVNAHHIHRFDEQLYRQLVCYPQEVIPALDMALNEVVASLASDALPESYRIYVRPYNVLSCSNIRGLDPDDINKLITITGMVTRVSTIIPEMKVAFFECTVCAFSTQVEVDRGSIAEPQVCRQCNTKFSFKLIHNRSEFSEKQQVKLQESPDEMPAGQTPYTVLLYGCAELVDQVQPGERVTVTGIYRATAIRVNPKIRSIKGVYRTHIDVVHYRKAERKRLHDINADLRLSRTRIDQLMALSNLPDIYERLAHSLAPSIYEHEDIKKGILLQLFGGTSAGSQKPNPNRTTFRSEINILLCGDPGTSKSQLLQYVYNLVPRGQYTSGKGSSAVGLTAYVTKDPDSRQMVLQTGALVLADGGICCIDEFDKMNDSTRSVLHEVMEQQTLSIAKAGIVCQLNARTSILAAANPVESQWNKNKTIMENIQLPPTLMSRFDLIFLMLDPQSDEYDSKLAAHLTQVYHKDATEIEQSAFFDTDLLKDYIGYARSTFRPILSKEAQDALKVAYVEMRKVGARLGQVTAYPRQLEALVRLAEAHAKMRFKNMVDLEDVEEAKRLHREALKQSAVDPASGRIDVSILTTGMCHGASQSVED